MGGGGEDLLVVLKGIPDTKIAYEVIVESLIEPLYSSKKLKTTIYTKIKSEVDVLRRKRKKNKDSKIPKNDTSPSPTFRTPKPENPRNTVDRHSQQRDHFSCQPQGRYSSSPQDYYSSPNRGQYSSPHRGQYSSPHRNKYSSQGEGRYSSPALDQYPSQYRDRHSTHPQDQFTDELGDQFSSSPGKRFPRNGEQQHHTARSTSELYDRHSEKHSEKYLYELEEMKETNRQLEKDIEKLHEALKNTRDDAKNLRTRLSKIAGDQLKTNNPNITDLSDVYRPTNLGQQFSELYDNEWSDAYEEVQRTIQDETKSINLLHDTVKHAFSSCERKAKLQEEKIRDILLDVEEGADSAEEESGLKGMDNLHNVLIDIRKKILPTSSVNVAKEERVCSDIEIFTELHRLQESRMTEEGEFATDNEFFKRMLNLLPPKAYFDRDVQEQLQSKTESEENKRNGQDNDNDDADSDESPPRKRKKSKKKRKEKRGTDLFMSKSVTEIQEEAVFKQSEESFTNVKAKKSKKENTIFEPSMTPIASSSGHFDDSRSKLRAKIEELQAKRKLNDNTSQEKKRLRREKKKLKKKGKDMEKKQSISNTKAHNNLAVKGDNPKQTKTATKPIYNSEGNLVFSKFDFTSSGKKKQHSDLTGKDYKRLLEKIEKRNEKLSELKSKDETAAANLKEKFKWEAALHKAEGEKVKDNPELLKKALKRKEKIKEKRKKKWEERTQHVEKLKDAKQAKRTKNINARKQNKKENKMKKLKKKGRLIPGF